jgi:Zn-finger nucleic acid-binding protein
MPVCLCPACDEVFLGDAHDAEKQRCPRCGGPFQTLNEAEALQRARRQSEEAPPRSE